MKRYTTDSFISRAKEIHGEAYDYSKVEYSNLSTPVIIICPKHGEWLANANNHIFNKSGCPRCASEKRSAKKRLDFEAEARKIHGDKYDYSQSNYVTLDEEVTIICPRHGSFLQRPSVHLRGSGCKLCSGKKLDAESFLARAKSRHGDRFIYDQLHYTGYEKEIVVGCKVHGYFKVRASKHLESKNGGCRGCFVAGMKLTQQEFLRRAKQAHGEAYDYSKAVYKDKNTKIEIICRIHGSFWQNPFNHIAGQGCPTCPTVISSSHQLLVDALINLGLDVEINNRTVLPSGKELDIYLPDYDLAIEVDGVWFHSEKFNKGKHYHQGKIDEAESVGVRLMQFWDVEINNKLPIVMSMIKSKLGLIRNKIPARRTTVGPISHEQYKEFLNDNHLQGAVQSAMKHGLYYEGRLVAVMGITKRQGEYHIDRFSSSLNTTVIGGFSKLLKSFDLTGTIVSYSSNRYSRGEVYQSNGFSLSNSHPWMLFYTDGKNIYSRNKFQKHRLTNLPGYSPSKTADEILKENNIFPIWSSGTKCWKLTF